MQTIVVVTLFPELIENYLVKGVVRRSLSKTLSVICVDLRQHGIGTQQSVDDRPFGGGPGMVLKIDVLVSALAQAKQYAQDAKVVALTPIGTTVTQTLFSHLQKEQQSLILFCGRYEGFDQRFLDHYVDEFWSVGDFILSGGELAALICIDAIARLHPGTLSDPDSALAESFSSNYLLDYPHYTRPFEYEGHCVPEILLGGDHKKIARWRQDRAEELTNKYRPDLWQLYQHTAQKK